MPRAPSWSSAERRARARSRRSRRPPRRPRSAARRSRRAARRATRRRSAGPRAPPRRAGSPAAGARGVEDDAARLARRDRPRRGRSAAGRRPARCRSRPRRRRRARASGAPARGYSRRRSTCESPVRVATLPSSVIADLNSTHGRPVRACLRNAWLSSRARGGDLAVGDVDRRCPRRAGSPARGRRPSRSGRRRRRRRARCRPAMIASVQGGVLPVWQHGSSET